jgi:hypothetical protein
MLKILLLQQVDQKLYFCNEARWILEMKSSSRTILRKLQWFSAASGVNVVSVISSIDTGFALPAIADFEKLITPKQKQFLFVIQETQRVICIQRRNDAAC